MRYVRPAMFTLTGFLAGAWLDTPIMHLVNPPPVSFIYSDRAEMLASFPPPGSIPFVGDSHVERGIWGARIANYGIGGDTAAGVLQRLDAVKPADRYILLIGVNDIIAGRSPESVADDVRHIIEHRSGATLLTVMPVRSRYAEHNPAIRNLNALFSAICTGTCRLIDTWAALQADDELDPRFTNDGLHLNAEGYGVLRALLVPGQS